MSNPVDDAVAALRQVESSETANCVYEQRPPGTLGEQHDVKRLGDNLAIPAHFSGADVSGVKKPGLNQG